MAGHTRIKLVQTGPAKFTATNAAGAAAQRYYRVLLLP